MVVVVAEKMPPGRRAVFNVPEWFGRLLLWLSRAKEPKYEDTQ